MSRLAVEAEKLRFELLRFAALVDHLDRGSRVQVARLLEEMLERISVADEEQR